MESFAGKKTVQLNDQEVPAKEYVAWLEQKVETLRRKVRQLQNRQRQYQQYEARRYRTDLDSLPYYEDDRE